MKKYPSLRSTSASTREGMIRPDMLENRRAMLRKKMRSGYMKDMPMIDRSAMKEFKARGVAGGTLVKHRSFANSLNVK